MTRRNPDRYTADDWRQAGPTVGAILANRWLVYTECDPWALSSPRRRGRIARERGPGFVLWGRATTCRRMGCPGRVTFWVRPHGASGDVAMT
jgi:hypothetical protein